MHGRFMRRAIALAVLALGLMLTGFAGAAPGDFVAQVTFSQDCGSGLGVGVAYDGAGHLWVSCYASNPDLLRASASTGTVDQTYNIENGLGALAYDSTRNALWAGPGCGNDPSSIQLIQLDATRSVTGSAAAFVPAGFGDCLDDGIAYDATNDSIYYSPDGSTTIGHFKTDGTSLGSFGWTGKRLLQQRPRNRRHPALPGIRRLQPRLGRRQDHAGSGVRLQHVGRRGSELPGRGAQLRHADVQPQAGDVVEGGVQPEPGGGVRDPRGDLWRGRTTACTAGLQLDEPPGRHRQPHTANDGRRRIG
jgi:hypothetical protein